MHKLLLSLITSVFFWLGLQFTFGTPIYLEGNPSCVSLWYAYGAKVDPPIPGTYPLGNGTFTWSISASGQITWSSTMSIDAMIVKWWPNANVYVYNPESMGDQWLVTPTNPNNGNLYGLSHIEACYDYEVQLTKTANPFFTREYLWSIMKEASTTGLSLVVGETGTIDYTVVAESTGFLDKDRGATGTISILNPDPQYSAMITNIVEQLTGAIVSCPVSFPYSLAPGATLICSYTVTLPDNSPIDNIVMAETTGKVWWWSASVSIIFDQPTTLVDQYATIEDDKFWFLWTGMAWTQFMASYSMIVWPYAMSGMYNFENTAILTTSTLLRILSSVRIVPIVVTDPPVVDVGCTYTQWYWKTHNIYGKGNNKTAWGVGPGEDALFFISNQSWYQVLNTVPKWGNPYYILAHQYIAAMLNKWSWASVPSEVEAALTWSESIFAVKTPASTFTAQEKTQMTMTASLLDSYNNGIIGPGHCD